MKIKKIKIQKEQKEIIIIKESGEYIIELVGEGAQAQILGLFIGKNNDEFIIKTTQSHLAPNTKSDLLIKSVLYDSSKLNFDGLIKIEKAAQRSDAYQRNESLVMNTGARVDTKPTLEILANDVRCTHGATIGKIDEEQLFYLNSRGINKKEAERLIIEGFFEGVLSRIKDKNLQGALREKIAKRIN